MAKAIEDKMRNIPNDQYSCTECIFMPEIKNINYESGEIAINCPEHGMKTMNIIDYFNNEIKNVYYNAECSTSHLKRKVLSNMNKDFYYCSDCKKVLCSGCKSKHPNHCKSLLNLKEINDKCPKHSEYNYKYCVHCKKHLCIDKSCESEHSKHKNCIEEIKLVKDYEKLEKQKEKILKNIENQKFFVKLLDILIETNKAHPHNYFNSINIQKALNIKDDKGIKVLKDIKNVKDDQKNSILIEKIKGLEHKILNYLNFKLNVKLNGKEKIINLTDKGIGTIELELLTGVNFENLEVLDLSNNNIEDIQSLKDLNSPKLKKVDLRFNHINSIITLKEKILKPKKFPNILEIRLENNPKLLIQDLEEIKKMIDGEAYNKECELEYIFKNKNIVRIFGEEFVKNNKDNCKIEINNESKELNEFEEKGENDKIIIKLKMNDNIKDIKCIFKDCEDLVSVKNIFYIDSTKVNDLSELFSGCSSLRSLPNSLSDWDTSQVTNISCMFYGCTKLESLPDISKWKTSKITDMMSLFNGCSSLSSLPDINKWDISNTKNISCLFINCSSLRKIPDIGNWNTENVTTMREMFNGCSRIKDLSFLTKWKTSNVTNMQNMFKGCTSLTKRPEIEKWDLTKIKNQKDMFKDCP